MIHINYVVRQDSVASSGHFDCPTVLYTNMKRALYKNSFIYSSIPQWWWCFAMMMLRCDHWIDEYRCATALTLHQYIELDVSSMVQQVLEAFSTDMMPITNLMHQHNGGRISYETCPLACYEYLLSSPHLMSNSSYCDILIPYYSVYIVTTYIVIYIRSLISSVRI